MAARTLAQPFPTQVQKTSPPSRSFQEMVGQTFLSALNLPWLDYRIRALVKGDGFFTTAGGFFAGCGASFTIDEPDCTAAMLSLAAIPPAAAGGGGNVAL